MARTGVVLPGRRWIEHNVRGRASWPALDDLVHASTTGPALFVGDKVVPICDRNRSAEVEYVDTSAAVDCSECIATMLCESVREVIGVHRERRHDDELPGGVLVGYVAFRALMQSRLWNLARSTSDVGTDHALFGVPVLPSDRLGPGEWQLFYLVGAAEIPQ